MVNYYRINKNVSKWLSESKANKDVMWKYNYEEDTLYIYTDRPGYLIGYKGHLFNKYEAILKKEIKELKNVKIIETNIVYCPMNKKNMR